MSCRFGTRNFFQKYRQFVNSACTECSLVCGHSQSSTVNHFRFRIELPCRNRSEQAIKLRYLHSHFVGGRSCWQLKFSAFSSTHISKFAACRVSRTWVAFWLIIYFKCWNEMNAPFLVSFNMEINIASIGQTLRPMTDSRKELDILSTHAKPSVDYWCCLFLSMLCNCARKKESHAINSACACLAFMLLLLRRISVVIVYNCCINFQLLVQVAIGF